MTSPVIQPPSQRPSFRCRNKGDSISGAFLLLGRAGDFFIVFMQKIFACISPTTPYYCVGEGSSAA